MRGETRAELLVLQALQVEKAWAVGWEGPPVQLGPIQSVPGEVLPAHGSDWPQTGRPLVRTQKPCLAGWLPSRDGISLASGPCGHSRVNRSLFGAGVTLLVCAFVVF